jgi:phosphate transport system permease protein
MSAQPGTLAPPRVVEQRSTATPATSAVPLAAQGLRPAGAGLAARCRRRHVWGGREAFATFGWHFLVSTAWDPGNDVYGALVPVYGTIVTSLIAC